MNYINPLQHHTTGQKDPGIDKLLLAQEALCNKQYQVIGQTLCAYITQYCLLQRTIRARKIYVFLDPFSIY